MIDLLTIEEVAERLRVSVLTVRWLRQEGRFAPAIKVGGGRLVPARAAAPLFRRQPPGRGPPGCLA
jgi:excisionase family DNA binding protein